MTTESNHLPSQSTTRTQNQPQNSSPNSSSLYRCQEVIASLGVFALTAVVSRPIDRVARLRRVFGLVTPRNNSNFNRRRFKRRLHVFDFEVPMLTPECSKTNIQPLDCSRRPWLLLAYHCHGRRGDRCRICDVGCDVPGLPCLGRCFYRRHIQP